MGEDGSERGDLGSEESCVSLSLLTDERMVTRIKGVVDKVFSWTRNRYPDEREKLLSDRSKGTL